MKLAFLLSMVFLSSLLLNGQASYHEVDNFVRNYNGKLLNLENLTNDLIKQFNSEADKARAIYTWITENIKYDFEKSLNKKPQKFTYSTTAEKEQKLAEIDEQSIKTTFRKRTGVCEDYSNLFCKMCKIAGIRVVIIEGATRDDPKQVGKSISKFDHQWNAVCLENKWYIVDATWGSGNLDPVTKKFIKLFKDEYFLLDPKLSILDHFPKKSEYQYLPKVKTKEELIKFPIIGYGFLKYKVNDYYPSEAIIISTGKSEQEIKIKFEMDMMDKLVVFENLIVTKIEIKKNEDGYYAFDYNLKGKTNKILTIAAIRNNETLNILTYKIN